MSFQLGRRRYDWRVLAVVVTVVVAVVVAVVGLVVMASIKIHRGHQHLP